MGYCSRCTLTARWISHTIASFINLEMAEARQGEARVVSSLLLVSPCEVVVYVSWWFVCHICVLVIIFMCEIFAARFALLLVEIIFVTLLKGCNCVSVCV